jgi:hypothetical protein
VEVQGQFVFRSTSLGKQCTSYNAPPTSKKLAANFRIVEQAVLAFHVRFSMSKALPPLENHSLSHFITSIGLMDEL